MAYTIAYFSGGKDSTAMVLRMIETGWPVGEVVYCDTGLEFPAMTEHIRKVSERIKSAGVKFTVLKADSSFYGGFLDAPVTRGDRSYHGYGWPNFRMRWCTKSLKTDVSEAYVRRLRAEKGEVTECVGIASDEAERAQRWQNRRANRRHPLIEWGWTEADCLAYCYSKGFDWYDESNGMRLYDLFSRTSCWICPLGRVDQFRRLRRYYPEMWAEIGRMEAELRLRRESEGMADPKYWRYNMHASWAELDARFAKEESDVPGPERFLPFG